MRRLISRIAILAVCSFGFIGIASAAPASAASCVANQSGIYYTGGWQWTAFLNQCSGVSAVQFAGSSQSSQVGVTWVQGTGGRFYPALETQVQEVDGISSYYARYYSVYVFGPGCGAPPITVHTSYVYRIYNAAQRSWGSWHGLQTTNYQIC